MSIESARGLIKFDEGVLRNVARVGFVFEDRACEPERAGLMPLDQKLECLTVAFGDFPAQILIGNLRQAGPLPSGFGRYPGLKHAKRGRKLSAVSIDATLTHRLDESGVASVYRQGRPDQRGGADVNETINPSVQHGEMQEARDDCIR